MTGTGENAHILIVDDDRLVLALIGRGLRDAGYRVTEASDSASALRAVAADAPDLALLDVRMPGMGGVETARRLLEGDRASTVVLISLDPLPEPDDLGLASNLGLSLALSGDYPAALHYLRPLAGNSQSTARMREDLALVYGLSGDDKAAAEIAGIDLDPHSVQSNLAYYKALRRWVLRSQKRAAHPGALSALGATPPAVAQAPIDRTPAAAASAEARPALAAPVTTVAAATGPQAMRVAETATAKISPPAAVKSASRPAPRPAATPAATRKSPSAKPAAATQAATIPAAAVPAEEKHAAKPAVAETALTGAAKSAAKIAVTKATTSGAEVQLGLVQDPPSAGSPASAAERPP